MKHFLHFLGYMIPCALIAQTAMPDTLRNLPSGIALEAHLMSGTTQNGTPEWGSYLGHNIYGDEGFAERYDISGQAEVVGIVAHLGGHSASTNRNANFRVYPVSSTGLPGAPLQTRAVPIQSLSLGSTPTIVQFTTPVAVSTSFFVGMEFTDYSHNGTGGDTIHILAGPAGSRSSADLAQTGRNAVRWHSHGPTPNWKDFYTENFSPIATHLGLFPIINTTSLSLSEQEQSAGVFLYPNPALPGSNVRFSGNHSGVVSIRVFDLQGRLVLSMNDIEMDLGFALSQEIRSGIYTVEVNVAGSQPTYQMFSVR